MPCIVFTIALAAGSPGYGQTAFEAASVKPNQGGGKRDRNLKIEPGRITITDITLGDLMMMAYRLKRYQLSGPGWIVSGSSAVSFDLTATTGKAVSPDELKRMIGPLLAERFHLQFHRETREQPVFALVPAKGGPKVKEQGDGGAPALRPNAEGGLTFKNWSMEDLADWLGSLPAMGMPVLNRTGLTGSFSFDANLFGLERGAEPGMVKKAMLDGEVADTVRSTLPEQLGLKLEAQKAQLEMIVIDHADRAPTDN